MRARVVGKARAIPRCLRMRMRSCGTVLHTGFAHERRPGPFLVHFSRRILRDLRMSTKNVDMRKPRM